MTPLFSKEKPAKDSWFLPEDQRQAIQKIFADLKDPVTLAVFTSKGQNDPYNDFVLAFLRDLGRLSDKIVIQEHTLDSKAAKTSVVNRSPTILIQPDKYTIRYTGAPSGEEGRSFLQAIILASKGESGLSSTSKEILASLTEKRQSQIFVTPLCPYCPGQVVHAVRAAIEKPDLVSAECVETGENPDMADQINVGSVPQTVINGISTSKGFEPEEVFMAELVTMKTSESLLSEDHHEYGHEHAVPIIEMDVVIIGAGPAGLTAAIYAERAGLKTVVLEKSIVGGQVALTPVVENYPGFATIAGKTLMDMIAAQARQYTTIHEGEGVEEIKVGKMIEAITPKGTYLAKGLILATGATWKKLGVPGEDRLFGHGVSHCATCDGYLFKGKKVLVVGGGNTALTDALYLKNLGAQVSMAHRRDAFRAEQHLQDSVHREQIPVLWNTVITEIKGQDRVEAVVLENQVDKTTRTEAVDAVFVAVGEQPNSQLARDIGLELTPSGAVKVDRNGRTNIPRIYSAGDLTGGINQIVTAVSEGSIAALSAFEDIQKRAGK